MICSDGLNLFVAEDGTGPAILFAHEFGGDWRTWDRIVGRLSGDFRCVRFCARGFRPSDCPDDIRRYGQAQQVDDLLSIAERTTSEQFHLVGISMGSFTSLMFALRHSSRLLSLTLMGCSSGPGGDRERVDYHRALGREIRLLEKKGGRGAVEWFSSDPAYRRVASKAPAAWRKYLTDLGGQSVAGALNTLRTVHWERPNLFGLSTELAAIDVPTLLVHGDEDHPCIEPTNAFLESAIPRCRRLSLSGTGHLVHIEEPDAVETALREHVSMATQAPSPAG